MLSKSLKISSGQKARSLELRAATSLAKLLLDTPDGVEISVKLRKLIDWFKEGLELPDMIAAKAILKLVSESKAN